MLDTAATANPPLYSKVYDTFRPRARQCATTRTDLGRIRFVDFLKPSSVRNRLVAEHVAKGRPACIKYGLSHVGLGESGSVHITHCDVVELQHDASRELVLKIPAGICWSTTPPKIALSALVNLLKGVSARRLRQERSDVAKRYWKGRFWSASYFIASMGGAPIAVLRPLYRISTRTARGGRFLPGLKAEVSTPGTR